MAVVNGAGRGARAGRVSGGGARRVSGRWTEAVGGHVEGREHRLLVVLQAVCI